MDVDLQYALLPTYPLLPQSFIPLMICHPEENNEKKRCYLRSKFSSQWIESAYLECLVLHVEKRPWLNQYLHMCLDNDVENEVKRK